MIELELSAYFISHFFPIIQINPSLLNYKKFAVLLVVLHKIRFLLFGRFPEKLVSRRQHSPARLASNFAACLERL